MSSLLASAVIATRDRPRRVEATLRALSRQSLASERYEVVVVDDGSSPVLELSGARSGDSATVLVRLPGLGRSEARNHGARVARGGVLVFVDDDIRVGETFLEAHLAGHAEWPQALLTGAIRLPEAVLRTPFGRFRQRLEDGLLPAGRAVGLGPNFAAAGNLSIERTDFLSLGGFDPTLQSAEDQDLALRFLARGGRTGYLPEALGVHDDDALDLRRYCRRMEWGYEHLVAFCVKHPEWPDNRERHLVNGPIRWGEPPGAMLRKLLKRALASAPAAALAFAAVDLLERAAPRSAALESGYRILLGAFLLKGFSRGLERYGVPRAAAA